MTIALSTLITGFSEFIGAKSVESVVTGGDATKLIDTELSIYGDGWFDEWWIYVTSGLADGDIRQVETFTNATKTLDPYVDFSAAVAADDTYELNKYNKQDIIDALNDALVSIYSKLYRKVVFESLGQDDLASNANSGQADVVVSDGTLFFEGQKLTLKDDDNSEDVEIASISTNTLTMTAVLTNSYTTAKNAKVVAKSGKYFNLGATIGNSRITGVFVRSTSTSKRSPFTNCEVIQSLAGDRQLYFPSAVSVDDKVWVIEAKGRLESVTDPTDTVTIDDHRVKLLYAETAFHFFNRKANDISAGNIERLKFLAGSYRDDVHTTYRNLWMAKPIEIADISTDYD